MQVHECGRGGLSPEGRFGLAYSAALVAAGEGTSALSACALTAPNEDIILSSMDWRDLETFSFGDGPDLADSLLDLVLSGTKCATCWAESQGMLSAEVGKLMTVLDGQGVPRAVLKTVELTKRRFDEVDEAFAYDEGEGDRSLRYWREAHTRYFTRLGIYAPDMMLWCERFELVNRID
jgi:uncharacterized protein YhfF